MDLDCLFAYSKLKGNLPVQLTAIGEMIKSGAQKHGIMVESAIDDCQNFMKVQSKEIISRKYKKQ